MIQTTSDPAARRRNASSMSKRGPPERESSCETMRTSFDFMKSRGLASDEERVRG